uniref:Secreted protein n=1 Tax=Macrostomum lignano TaxID=282301 RepID=A0A1I8IJV0_9PLAT
ALRLYPTPPYPKAQDLQSLTTHPQPHVFPRERAAQQVYKKAPKLALLRSRARLLLHLLIAQNQSTFTKQHRDEQVQLHLPGTAGPGLHDRRWPGHQVPGVQLQRHHRWHSLGSGVRQQLLHLLQVLRHHYDSGIEHHFRGIVHRHAIRRRLWHVQQPLAILVRLLCLRQRPVQLRLRCRARRRAADAGSAAPDRRYAAQLLNNSTACATANCRFNNTLHQSL